jgi:hypothetical protein
VRDSTEVDLEGLLGTMLDYLALCSMECGHERWRWNVSPRFFYELRKMKQTFGNPPVVTYGNAEDTLWGFPILVTTFVEDVELEEVR